MSILGLGLFFVFIILSWFTNTLNPPYFLIQPFLRTTRVGLHINVQPTDAAILINDKEFDPNIIPLPGDYTIKVTRTGYLPAEEYLRILPNRGYLLSIDLVPIQSVEEISEDVNYFGWGGNGDLVYYNDYKGSIYKWSAGLSSELVNIPTEVYQILPIQDGENIVILAAVGVDAGAMLYLLNLNTNQQTPIPHVSYVGLGSDGKTIWGNNSLEGQYMDKPVWSMLPGEQLKFYTLEDPELSFYADDFKVDSSNTYLAIDGANKVGVWNISTGALEARFENASDPVWILYPHAGLVYKDNATQTLKFSRADLSWSVFELLNNYQGPVTGMIGGEEIIFCRYNPFTGGTSFWVVDPGTASVRLLAESSLETGHAEKLSLSQDGKDLAFTNQDHELFIVHLKP